MRTRRDCQTTGLPCTGSRIAKVHDNLNTVRIRRRRRRNGAKSWSPSSLQLTDRCDLFPAVPAPRQMSYARHVHTPTFRHRSVTATTIAPNMTANGRAADGRQVEKRQIGQCKVEKHQACKHQVGQRQGGKRDTERCAFTQRASARRDDRTRSRKSLSSKPTTAGWRPCWSPATASCRPKASNATPTSPSCCGCRKN